MGIEHILTLTPEFGVTESIEFITQVDESEDAYENRDAVMDHGIREYILTTRLLTEDQMNTIWEFYKARQGSTDDFLIKIIHEFQAVNEMIGFGSLSVGDGSTRQFLLNNFPVDISSNNSATIDGVETADYVLSNDTANEKSYITFNSAPALGAVLLSSYEYYLRVRFKDDNLTQKLLNYDILNAGINLREVRWNTYFPINGNSSSSSSSSSFAGTLNSYILGIHGHRYFDDPENDFTDFRRFFTGQVTTKFNITRMIVYLNVAPGVGKKSVFTIYKNAEPTNFVLTLYDNDIVADVNGLISCNDGDFIYIRQDSFSANNSSIHMGFAIENGFLNKCPILSAGGWSTAPLAGYGGSYGNVFSPYENDQTDLAYHSLFIVPGYIANVQARNNRTVGIHSDGVDTYQDVIFYKKIGTDKYGLTSIDFDVTGIEIYGEDKENVVRVNDGDLIHWEGNSVLDINGSTQPGGIDMKSFDYISDTNKLMPHCANLGYSNGINESLFADVFCPIHGVIGFYPLNKVKEPFTLFAINGTIKQFVIKANTENSYFVDPTHPLIFTLRKNGEDTEHVFTLTNTKSEDSKNINLQINTFDRISLKLSQNAEGNNVSVNVIWLAWSFESQGFGQWPLFNSLMYRTL